MMRRKFDLTKLYLQCRSYNDDAKGFDHLHSCVKKEVTMNALNWFQCYMDLKSNDFAGILDYEIADSPPPPPMTDNLNARITGKSSSGINNDTDNKVPIESLSVPSGRVEESEPVNEPIDEEDETKLMTNQFITTAYKLHHVWRDVAEKCPDIRDFIVYKDLSADQLCVNYEGIYYYGTKMQMSKLINLVSTSKKGNDVATYQPVNIQTVQPTYIQQQPSYQEYTVPICSSGGGMPMSSWASCPNVQAYADYNGNYVLHCPVTYT